MNVSTNRDFENMPSLASRWLVALSQQAASDIALKKGKPIQLTVGWTQGFVAE